MANKKLMTFDSRDFYEKAFGFFHNGKFYRYTSQIRDCEVERPRPKQTVRGMTIYNVGIMERDPESGKIRYTCVA